MLCYSNGTDCNFTADQLKVSARADPNIADLTVTTSLMHSHARFVQIDLEIWVKCDKKI